MLCLPPISWLVVLGRNGDIGPAVDPDLVHKLQRLLHASISSFSYVSSLEDKVGGQ